MADATSLTIGADEVRAFAAQLKAFHGKAALTGQNDGSNETDTQQDNLELTDKAGEMAGFRGTYGEMNAAKRLDLAALTLLGMEQASTFDEAMTIAKDRNGPDLDAFREMPLSPNFLLSGLDQVGMPGGDDIEAKREPQ
ncbi:hypothetical protein HK107_06380 [Parvularcula sp. ZS-1/3]|uniref:Uncharacterized protein n=1 Tax=Parvularcula mediterranea TaxID=2732508 RepID=A0A7Y3RKW6_9PROT|nr:hypothetical protein [Parvularcula mediterranea]NNU15948.1 hypothetical protein [Parvularcula mediterranea]